MAKPGIPEWIHHAWMAVAGTIGAATPVLVQASAGGLTPGEAVSGLAAGALATGVNVLGGVLGNAVFTRFRELPPDPEDLLANHHLHRLTAEAVRVVLNGSKRELLSEYDLVRVGPLADAVVDEWNELSETPGFRDDVRRLSREDLEHWFEAGLRDEATAQPPLALTPETWAVLLKAVGAKHGCTLTDVGLKTVTARLTEQLPLAVRELLKQGGPACNAALFLLIGKTLGVVTETLREVRQRPEMVPDLAQLGPFLETFRDAAEQLKQQINALPDRATIVALFERQARGTDAILDALRVLQAENRSGHDDTHRMLEKLLAALPAPAPGPAAAPTALHPREPVATGAEKNLVLRVKERNRLRKVLIEGKDPKRVAYVQGMSGVGKSYLVEWFVFVAWAEAHGAGGTTVTLTLRTGEGETPQSSQELLEELCDRCKVAPSDPEVWSKLDAALGQPGVLLRVENLDHRDAVAAVAGLLHPLTHVTAALTGRVESRGHASGWEPVELEPFDEDGGLAQLKKELGRGACCGRFRRRT